MVIKTLIPILFLLYGCSNPITEEEQVCDCSIYIYSNLPQNENGVYQLQYNESLSMTYSHLYVETECGLHTKVSWDSDYVYQIVEGQWISLINPSSMTDEDGKGTIVYGVWESFIGKTITLYGGYYDDCNHQFVDSVKVEVIQ